MTAQKDILNLLLDKYENSKHLTQPGVSHRRVMLCINKKELPGYDYEDASVRDTYHAAAQELEQKHLVHLEWLGEHLLLSSIVLNLRNIMQCYAEAARMHPQEKASAVESLVANSLQDITTQWIKNWQQDVCTEARKHLKVPVFCKKDITPLRDLLISFQKYDQLRESVTIRAFSSKCFHDTKYFERNVRDLFLRIARQYDKDLAFACEENALGVRNQLAILGIYARPELYELAGNCTIQTQYGKINIGATPLSGLALPSTLVDEIVKIDIDSIQCITLIENKTNYDEYLISERQSNELVIYHGGFLSPQKKKLFRLLSHTASEAVITRFWADIDMGGFQMFQHLQELFPRLQPMRMSGGYVVKYHQNGLKRSDQYLSRLHLDMENGMYLLFADAIAEILKYGVTIEQETFLN